MTTLGPRTLVRKHCFANRRLCYSLAASFGHASFSFLDVLQGVGGRLCPSLGWDCKGNGQGLGHKGESWWGSEVAVPPTKKAPLLGHSAASGAYLVKEAKNKRLQRHRDDFNRPRIYVERILPYN